MMGAKVNPGPSTLYSGSINWTGPLKSCKSGEFIGDSFPTAYVNIPASDKSPGGSKSILLLKNLLDDILC